MTAIQIFKAIPLELLTLDQQIKNAGGAGYNCDVVINRVENSFSTHYHFQTFGGEKVLQTQNQYQVGVIHCTEINFVMFNGDDGEYTLVTPKVIKKAPYKVLIIKHLGFSFDDMFVTLKSTFPNQIVWNLTHPDEALKELGEYTK